LRLFQAIFHYQPTTDTKKNDQGNYGEAGNYGDKNNPGEVAPSGV
jgi:hypothetical protein